MTQTRRLGAGDVELMHGALDVFSDVFKDPATYADARPDNAYLSTLLADDTFIALVALDSAEVIGALAGYVLTKFEQNRSEIAIYDLAVRAEHRRMGVATALINEVRRIAGKTGAWVVYVQADTGAEDAPAIALYSRLGSREDVLHFDLTPLLPGERAAG